MYDVLMESRYKLFQKKKKINNKIRQTTPPLYRVSYELYILSHEHTRERDRHREKKSLRERDKNYI